MRNHLTLTPSNALVPITTAARLTDLSVGELELLIASGRVRAERIKGERYVSLDDAERAVEGGDA